MNLKHRQFDGLQKCIPKKIILIGGFATVSQRKAKGMQLGRPKGQAAMLKLDIERDQMTDEKKA